MNIVVLTPDKSVANQIGTKKTSLIPSDLRSKYVGASIKAYFFENQTNDEIADYFLRGEDNTILLCDNRLASIGRCFATSLFTTIFDHSFGGKTMQNYFGMVISKTVKSFVAFRNRFDDEKLRKILILPLRNFQANDLKELYSRFRNGINPDGFADFLDQKLKLLRERQQPKTSSSYRTTYLVDDEDKYFEYGKERHLKPDTAPPHVYGCRINAVYRYGKRYDSERHFNVSIKKGEISGRFKNCHGVIQEKESCSHINMFPNDFAS